MEPQCWMISLAGPRAWGSSCLWCPAYLFSFALALISEFTVGLSLAIKGRGEWVPEFIGFPLTPVCYLQQTLPVVWDSVGTTELNCDVDPWSQKKTEDYHIEFSALQNKETDTKLDFAQV